MQIEFGASFIFLLFSVFITLLLMYGPKEEKKFLAAVIITAFLLRVIFMYLLHWQSYLDGFKGFVLGDDRLYSMKALKIALIWQNKPYNPMFDMGGADYGINPFTYLLALYYRFFNCNYLSSKLINCLIGSFTPLFLYFTAKNIFSPKIAKIPFLLASFYPSIVYWSICNLRDPLVIFLITFCAYLISGLKNSRSKILRLCLIAFSIYLLKDLQKICFYAAIGAIVCSVIYRLLASLKKKEWIILSSIILAAFIIVLYNQFWPVILKQIRLIIVNNSALYLSDSAGYRIYDCKFLHAIRAGTLDIAGFIKAYFTGLAYFLFSPFPWRITRMSQLIACQQTMLWISLLLFSILGFREGFKLSFNRTMYILTFVFIGISFFSIAEANIGAAFRHRDYFAPLVFIFAAKGIMQFLGKNDTER
ncbi:MAG: glycosyltransferase family 39 protein [Candidatus Omnitrophota bacterium]|jgi:hypothetical protein